EDGVAVEAEQQGYDEHYEAPIAELSPAVHAFQALTIRKWQDYLDSVAAKRSERGFVEMPKSTNGVAEEASV
ncbi:MAG: aromatic ring-hydroxylating dioxygenase subunit alpha, partial [Myxococcota bacterium]